MLCGLAFLGITLCTMFPLAPRPIKLVALYVSMTLIIVIFSVLIVRGLVAMTTWILLGRSLWIFPHLLSEVRLRALACSGRDEDLSCLSHTMLGHFCQPDCVAICLSRRPHRTHHWVPPCREVLCCLCGAVCMSWIVSS